MKRIVIVLALLIITSSKTVYAKDVDTQEKSCYVWVDRDTKANGMCNTTPKAASNYSITWLDNKITLREIKLLCIATWCESGNQDKHTQMLVASTMLNRLADDRFPDTVEEVVFQKNQYAVTSWEGFPEVFSECVTDSVEEAVYMALTIETVPKDLFYFRNSYYHKGRVPYLNNGVLYFSRQGDV